MGVWGAGILENDDALDFVLHWHDYVVPTIDSGAWNAEKAWSFFRNLYFRRSFNILDSKQNAEMLALAALFKQHSLALPDELKIAAENSANRELRVDALQEWENRKDRKNVLIEFLSTIGGERRTLGKGELGDKNIAAEIEKLLPFTRKFSR